MTLNATQAAIRAGYSPKTAAQIGERLLRKVEVQALLTERMKARERLGMLRLGVMAYGRTVLRNRKVTGRNWR